MGSEALKPCPCGKTPPALGFIDGQSAKYGFVVPLCCGEWHIEFRTGYKQLESAHKDEIEKLMVDAWNKAPRSV